MSVFNTGKLDFRYDEVISSFSRLELPWGSWTRAESVAKMRSRRVFPVKPETIVFTLRSMFKTKYKSNPLQFRADFNPLQFYESFAVSQGILIDKSESDVDVSKLVPQTSSLVFIENFKRISTRGNAKNTIVIEPEFTTPRVAVACSDFSRYRVFCLPLEKVEEKVKFFVKSRPCIIVGIDVGTKTPSGKMKVFRVDKFGRVMNVTDRIEKLIGDFSFSKTTLIFFAATAMFQDRQDDLFFRRMKEEILKEAMYDDKSLGEKPSEIEFIESVSVSLGESRFVESLNLKKEEMVFFTSRYQDAMIEFEHIRFALRSIYVQISYLHDALKNGVVKLPFTGPFGIETSTTDTFGVIYGDDKRTYTKYSDVVFGIVVPSITGKDTLMTTSIFVELDNVLKKIFLERKKGVIEFSKTYKEKCLEESIKSVDDVMKSFIKMVENGFNDLKAEITTVASSDPTDDYKSIELFSPKKIKESASKFGSTHAFSFSSLLIQHQMHEAD